MDSREKAMFEYLPQFEVQTLKTGDYIVGEYIIERKTYQDYYSSVKDGRIININKMMKTEYKPILLLEGPPKYENIVGEHMKNYVANTGIHVHITNSINESADFLSTLKKLWFDPILSILPESWLIPEVQQISKYDKLYIILGISQDTKLLDFVKKSNYTQNMKILTSINGISDNTAHQLLKKFSIKTILNNENKILGHEMTRVKSGRKYCLSKKKYQEIINFIRQT
jgi:ERCC4-type nuclease